MVQRSAYFLAVAALLLAAVVGLASATAVAIVRLSAPPAFGAPTGKVNPADIAILAPPTPAVATAPDDLGEDPKPVVVSGMVATIPGEVPGVATPPTDPGYDPKPVVVTG